MGTRQTSRTGKQTSEFQSERRPRERVHTWSEAEPILDTIGGCNAPDVLRRFAGYFWTGLHRSSQGPCASFLFVGVTGDFRKTLK